ncbi:hypothetical protein BDQ17DRAFT_1324451 [Cyathus striatus]|nr:hypothetical protein BDQ17DRAFT_1324451 [Cyathus striatus]
METQDVIPDVKFNYACVFVGGTFSYVQAAFYFRTYTDDLKRLKFLVCVLTLFETAQSSLLLPTLWHYLIVRGLDRPNFFNFLVCEDWRLDFQPKHHASLLNVVPSKKFVVAALVPFLIGWAFNGVYLVGMVKYSQKQYPRWRKRCYPEMNVNLRWMTNTLRLLRSLIIWTVASGLLMWLTSLTFVITYKAMPDTQLSLGIYLIRGRVYSNTMLALLNHRETHRKMANETVPGTLNIPTVHTDSMHSQKTLQVQRGKTLDNEGLPLQTFSISIGDTKSTSSSQELDKFTPVHYHPKELEGLPYDQDCNILKQGFLDAPSIFESPIGSQVSA